MIEYLRGKTSPSTLEEATRTIGVQWYSGATVQRYDWWTDEEWLLSFDMNPKAVDLGRFKSGAPLLKDHMPYIDEQIGVVRNARIDNGAGLADVQFSAREEVAPIWLDVKAGLMNSVSMGASIRQTRDITEKGKMKHLLAIDWEPMELSLVAVPADSGAHFLAFETRAQYLSFNGRMKPAATDPSAKPTASGARALERLKIAHARYLLLR